MGELDLLAVVVAVGGIIFGITHIIRAVQLKRLREVQVAANKILAEQVAVLGLIHKELQELRLDITLLRKDSRRDGEKP